MESAVSLSMKCASAITYAGEQNSIPVVQEIEIENNCTEALKEIKLVIEVEPDFATTKPVNIDSIEPGTKFLCNQIDLPLKQGFLSELKEAVRGAISVKVWHSDTVIAEIREPVEVLAYDQWAGWRQLPELLAAFAQPNCVSVADVLREASAKLLKEKKEAICGYQNPDRQAVARQIAAIYATIAEKGIHYSNPPANFTDYGQKIRLPDRIFSEHLGTCIDLSLLMVSCMEQAGLNPVILLQEGHSWAGCWLLDKAFPVPACDDKQAVRKRIDAGELILIETTGFTLQTSCSFSVAMNLGKEHLRDDNPKRFEYAIDVKRARGHRILPLPIRGQKKPIVAEVVQMEGESASLEDVELPPLAPEVIIPSSTSASKAEGGRIEQWKSKLLDLSLRNRLLNFKASKQVIPLYYPDPGKIEDLLADGQSLRIKSLPDLLSGSEIRSNEAQNRRQKTDLREAIAREAFKRGEFLAEIPADELDKRLTEIFRSARNAHEEGGSNTLYLSIGMLQWTETTDSSRPFFAPIILVPVTLERQAVRGGFSLKRHDDETIVNPTLLQMLLTQFDLEIEGITGVSDLPIDESGVDVDEIWARFRKAVIEQTGFEVKTDVHLGIFSFAKYLMWKDLNDRVDDILKSPIVKHLANRATASELGGGVFVPERDLDHLKHPHDLFTPADCDSSQLAAVNAAADGLSFVLEGPPGTGKSQTITNIIADSLARSKTVLFVSEKMAALNVVHDRLKKLGLGPFLLELHSSKASKSDVLVQLEQSLSAAGRHTVEEWESEAAMLAQVRQKLNEYVDVMHSKHKNGLTVYEATSAVVSKPDWKPCGFSWPSAEYHTKDDYNDLLSIVQQISTIGSLASGIDRFAFAEIKNCEWMPSWQADLLAQAKSSLESLEILRESCSSILQAIDFTDFSPRLHEMERLDQLCRVLEGIRAGHSKLLCRSDLASVVSFLENIATHGNARNELAAPLKNEYSEAFFALNAEELSQKWLETEGEWWLKKMLARNRILNFLRRYNKKHHRSAGEDIPNLLETLGKINREDGALNGAAAQAQEILGESWKNTETDWSVVLGLSIWLKDYIQVSDRICANVDQLVSLRLAIKKCAENGIDSFAPDGKIGLNIARFRAAFSTFKNGLARLATLCGTDYEILLGNDSTPQPPDTLHQKLTLWLNSPRVFKDWCLWNAVRAQATSKGLAPFLAELELGAVPYGMAPEYFRFCYADWWLGKVVDCTPVLSKFSSLEHERMILEFRERDAKFIQLTKKYIYAKLAARVPANRLPPATTPLGILLRELQKKSRHMPVRKLLAVISAILPDISPCLLMSPLSATQYLAAASKPFDLIIFDEASQIPTWDAVGAIARGNQVIVVGDPKQLPPTNFFNVSADTDAPDDETEVEDLESILDECIGSGLIVHSLKWHYRSRRESLIAFSNYRYYKSALITFPSPVLPDNGVVIHPVEGVYQRSGQRVNRQEAEAIIDHIRAHFENPEMRDLSIGVVTFSQAQQKLVEDLLDNARRNDADLDALISSHTQEPVFIKNLENVQGDERDVILFSICYGPDESGRVFMNFGPINKNGGHRRLNVAISRAKNQVHIFSTLRPENIDMGKTKSAGVSDLKLYLEYAQKGPSALLSHAAPSGRLPESPFETEVMNFLRDKGWTVHPQVGCSSYRIDLGVVDQRAPGRYLLAVECDGARYHSAATARDRDKLRQMVLEQLGWRVHRIWSTEWWSNPEREKGRLLTAIEAAVAAPVKSDLPSHKKEEKSVGRSESASIPPVQKPPAGAASTRPRFPLYEEAILRWRKKDQFFSDEDDIITEMIAEVIAVEGPVSNNIIKQRISDTYCFDRLGPRIAARIDALLPSLFSKTVENDRSFYWPRGIEPNSWRGFRSNGKRSLADIPVQELANIAEDKLKEIVVADEATLIKEIAAFLGILRITSQIAARFGEAIVYLKRKGRVEEVVGGLKGAAG